MEGQGNLELYEFVDKSKLTRLINSGKLKQEWSDEDKKKKHKWFNTTNFRGEMDALTTYFDNLDENGLVQITYKNKKNGRYLLPNCLSSMRRVYRNYLLKDDYYDFDMVNSCASILLYLGTKHNSKNLRCLRLYVNNRQKWFNKIKKEFKCDDKKAKEIMTSVTFGANIVFKDDELNAYRNSLILIQNELKETHLYDHIETDKGGLSWLAKLVQDVETTIVEGLIYHIINEHPQLVSYMNVIVAIYELDGFKLLKEIVDNFGGVNNVIEIINNWLSENFWVLELTNKSLTWLSGFNWPYLLTYIFSPVEESVACCKAAATSVSPTYT